MRKATRGSAATAAVRREPGASLPSGGWTLPRERTLSEEYRNDEREVDPATVKCGYWWAFDVMEEAPEIIGRK
jgi:hypothetical protein